MIASIPISEPLTVGRFLSRKRFILSVSVEGKVVQAFLPNTARLSQLLTPHNDLLLRPVPDRGKIPFDALIGFDASVPVVIDSRIPNTLVLTALQKKVMSEFQDHTQISSEVKVGNSRIDFRLKNGRTEFLEVKGVTLANHGIARFPDSPTERGRRHLNVLKHLAQRGEGAAILFLVMRPDVTIFEANSKTDPRFAEDLENCSRNKVKVICYASEYRSGQIRLTHKLSYRSKIE